MADPEVKAMRMPVIQRYDNNVSRITKSVPDEFAKNARPPLGER